MLDSARQLCASAQWAAAADALSACQSEPAWGAEDDQRLGLCLYMLDQTEGFVAAYDRAYHGFVAEQRWDRAAYCALWAGMTLLYDGQMPLARGWFGRIDSAVSHLPASCAERAYPLMPRTVMAVFRGELDEAWAVADTALQIAQTHDDAELAAVFRHLAGRIRLREGRIDEGLQLLDEAMLAILTNTFDPIPLGLTYCSVIAACQQVLAIRRAHDWTRALSGWCDGQPSIVAYTGTCQIHRAEVLRVGGAWEHALDEADSARQKGEATGRTRTAAHACYEAAEVYRLRGALDKAEAAYLRASDGGHDPQPGFALLRMAQGRVDAALATVRRSLAASRGPQRVRYLAACVEIALAANEIEVARTACEELCGYTGTDAIDAMAAHARAALCLAEDDAEHALVALDEAQRAWQAIGAPFEVARIRLLRARVCRALGDTDGEELELRAAHRALQQLGATAEDEPVPHGLTPREVEVLRLIATGSTNKEVASTLFVSARTVDRHMSNLFGKLGVNTRSAATAWYLKNLNG